MAAGMLACGLVYDLWLKPTSWAWVCFSVAFAILPVYAWFGAAQTLPPRFEFLLPLAALAGPALQLSNGLVDLDADRVARVWTAAVRLGRMRTLIVMAALLLVVHGLAWLTLVGASGPSMLVVGAASSLAATGLALSTRRSVRARALGWSAQAVAICLLGAGWLAAVA
jgi:4-hydroxybenzoate polyprenyltransferase